MSEIEITYVVELALPNTNAGNIHVIHIFYIMVYGRITPKLNIPKREKKTMYNGASDTRTPKSGHFTFLSNFTGNGFFTLICLVYPEFLIPDPAGLIYHIIQNFSFKLYLI